MERKLKTTLDRLGVWYLVALVRSVPAIIRWFGKGCSGPAPHSIKMRIIRAYLSGYEIGNFVETGTYKGDTLGFIAKTGAKCASIELSKEFYDRARTRFSLRENVRLIHGDSGVAMPKLLEEISEPTLFWLDGHYSAGKTAAADTHTPISAELLSIISHPVKRHVILIDDVHCFCGENGYPHLDELLRTVREDGQYVAEVTTDIIRLVPGKQR